MAAGLLENILGTIGGKKKRNDCQSKNRREQIVIWLIFLQVWRHLFHFEAIKWPRSDQQRLLVFVWANATKRPFILISPRNQTVRNAKTQTPSILKRRICYTTPYPLESHGRGSNDCVLECLAQQLRRCRYVTRTDGWARKVRISGCRAGE
jgi:hypothetical protein